MRVLFLPDYTKANAYQRLLSEALTERGVTVAADPTGRRRIMPILGAVRRQGRPDVIHLHWTEPYISGGRAEVSRVRVARTLAELRVLRRAGIGIVWTAHDLSRHDRPVEDAELAFDRSLLRLSSAVIVHCAAAVDVLAQTLGLGPSDAARAEVIPHGHYLGAYADTISRDEARRRLGLPAAGPVIAFVGWVRPYKGVRELVEAFARVEEPAARLVVAGRPGTAEFEAEILALAARDPRVVARMGFVPDDELQVYLRAADAVCLPYREIFTSGSVLLAMSFGRAVIAPRRGCISEAVDEGSAILYDADDPNALIGALRRAMVADLARMGDHALERCAEFDWGSIADRTLEVYRRAARAAHASR